MAARNPPLWLQAGSHPATNDRLLLEALMAPPPAVVSGAGYGIVGPGDLAVTQNGTPNMSVNVAAGKVFIDGTENAVQGAYLGVNDATVNVAISASNPTNPRKDLVVARVRDAEWSGATNDWTLEVVTGTAAASPSEPAVPANSVVLALVDVAAGATSITNANITDRRRRAFALGGVVVCTSTTRPAAPYTGQLIYETDTDRPMVWDGSTWRQLNAKDDAPTCRVFHNANQNVPDAGFLDPVLFNQEHHDNDNMHSTSSLTGRITIVTPGVYVASFNFQMGGAADYLYVQGQIKLNNVTFIAGSTVQNNAGGYEPWISVTTPPVKLAAADFLSCTVFQDNGANAVRVIKANTCTFGAQWHSRG